jgi:tetratricopeptide (TPR) repeat protein
MGTPAATANAATLQKLARECRERGDLPAEASALERLLAADPRNIPALIRRADLYAAAGDARSASSFYLTAIRSAPATGLPRELAAELARAQQACDRYAIEYRDFLLRNLAAKGFDPKRSSSGTTAARRSGRRAQSVRRPPSGRAHSGSVRLDRPGGRGLSRRTAAGQRHSGQH